MTTSSEVFENFEQLKLEGSYSEYFRCILGKGRILASDVYNDYQGYAKYLVQLESGKFAVAEWSWGSCEGCCPYQGISDFLLLERELASCVSYLATAGDVLRYIENVEKSLHGKCWISAARPFLEVTAT